MAPIATVAGVPELKASPSGWLAWPSTLHRVYSPTSYTPLIYDDWINALSCRALGTEGVDQRVEDAGGGFEQSFIGIATGITIVVGVLAVVDVAA